MATLTCGEGGSTGAEVVTQINTNTTDITALDTRVTTLETTTGDNTTAIGDNTTSIADLDTRVTALEASLAPKPAYVAKASALPVPDVYNLSDIELDIADLVAGRYKIWYSFQADLQSEKDKVLNYQLTGDLAGDEFGISISTANLSEKTGKFYGFILEHAGGPFNFGMHFKDATGGQGFIIDYVDIAVSYWGELPPAP